MNFFDDTIEYDMDGIILEFDEFENDNFEIPFIVQEAVNEYRSMAN